MNQKTVSVPSTSLIVRKMTRSTVFLMSTSVMAMCNVTIPGMKRDAVSMT